MKPFEILFWICLTLTGLWIIGYLSRGHIVRIAARRWLARGNRTMADTTITMARSEHWLKYADELKLRTELGLTDSTIAPAKADGKPGIVTHFRELLRFYGKKH